MYGVYSPQGALMFDTDRLTSKKTFERIFLKISGMDPSRVAWNVAGVTWNAIAAKWDFPDDAEKIEAIWEFTHLEYLQYGFSSIDKPAGYEFAILNKTTKDDHRTPKATTADILLLLCSTVISYFDGDNNHEWSVVQFCMSEKFHPDRLGVDEDGIPVLPNNLPANTVADPLVVVELFYLVRDWNPSGRLNPTLLYPSAQKHFGLFCTCNDAMEGAALPA